MVSVVSRIKFESNAMEEEEPQYIIEVCHKPELEKFMNKISWWSITSEYSPVMTLPLANKLKSDGMAEYGDDILLVSSSEINDLD